METEIVWGEPIAVDYPNKPDWLADDQDITVRWGFANANDDRWASCKAKGRQWHSLCRTGIITHIKLPADHPHYQQTRWGDPIEVNGVRPEWLGDDELTVIKLSMDSYGTGPQELHVQQIWWESTSAIRLHRDHPAYTALAAGFTPWGGGESAPDDWDGGEVLFRDGGVGTIFRSSVCWNRDDPCHSDIIGYRKRAITNEDFLASLPSFGGGSEWSILTATPEPTTPEDMVADFYQEFGGAVIGTDNPRHLRILDALADVDESTVVVKRMTEAEARDLWDEMFDGDDFIACLAEMGITTPTTPLAQFIAANPGVVNDENRAAVELALGWGL